MPMWRERRRLFWGQFGQALGDPPPVELQAHFPAPPPPLPLLWPPILGRMRLAAQSWPPTIGRLLPARDWLLAIGRPLLNAHYIGRLLLAAHYWPPSLGRRLLAAIAGRLAALPHPITNVHVSGCFRRPPEQPAAGADAGAGTGPADLPQGLRSAEPGGRLSPERAVGSPRAGFLATSGGGSSRESPSIAFAGGSRRGHLYTWASGTRGSSEGGQQGPLALDACACGRAARAHADGRARARAGERQARARARVRGRAIGRRTRVRAACARARRPPTRAGGLVGERALARGRSRSRSARAARARACARAAWAEGEVGPADLGEKCPSAKYRCFR